MISQRTLLFLAVLVLIQNDASAEEHIVLASGTRLTLYELEGGRLVSETQLLDPAEWVGLVWPSWRASTRSVLFQGRRTEGAEGTGVYELQLSESRVPATWRRLSDRRLPSASPSGEFLATIDESDRLWVSQADGGSQLLQPSPVVFGRPVVWVDASSLLFLDPDRQLWWLDVRTGRKRSTGVEGLVPAALIGRGEVLCVDYEGRAVSLLGLETSEVRVVKRYLGTSVGLGLVWDGSRDSIILSRQTWPNILRFSESHDLYRVGLDGSEERLARDLSIFGGFALP